MTDVCLQVKWRGLSFRECTWETAKDINDDDVIADFHKINDNPPDEPPLTQAEIGLELSKSHRTSLVPAGANGLKNPAGIQDLDAMVGLPLPRPVGGGSYWFTW